MRDSSKTLQETATGAAMRFNPRRWLNDLPLNTRIFLLVGLLVAATVVITTLVIKWTKRRFVEDAIGDQMVIQARIAAHLVAIAEEKRDKPMTTDEINRHLKDTIRFAREQRNFEYEFWITDSAAHAYVIPSDRTLLSNPSSRRQAFSYACLTAAAIMWTCMCRRAC